MAVSTALGTDVAQLLAGLLADVDEVRVYWFVSDAVRPPAVVIGQPTLNFADPEAGFCRATWTFPLTVITTRANDREAQLDMSRLLLAITAALDVDVPELFEVTPLEARPIPVTIGQTDLPGYLLTVRVRS